MAMGQVLRIGNHSITLQNSCSTDHKLKVMVGNNTYCAPATTTWAADSLHVNANGTVYTICDGECGGGTWVMPEEPDDPIVITDPECTGPTLTPNAYLLSDGRQWFDTGVEVNTANNIELTVQVINGKHARIIGTKNSSCYYDISIAASGVGAVRMGTSTTNTSVSIPTAQRTTKNTWKTETINTTKKRIKLNNVNKIQKDLTSACSASNTIMVLNGDAMQATLDPTQSGGIKLYNIKLYDTSGTLVHDFEPVPAGTNVCGHMAQTNCMWDTVDKKLYYPAGTGQMGYGVD